MQKIMKASFSSVDAAEYAAAYLQQHIPHIAQVAITPLHPKSIEIGEQPQTLFSVYTTAALSAHNITGRIERPITPEEIPEPERNQTANLELSCREEAQSTVQAVLTALGGEHVIALTDAH